MGGFLHFTQEKKTPQNKNNFFDKISMFLITDINMLKWLY